MATITENMFHASYEIGKRWHGHSLSYKESIRILRDQYRMNPSSADDYLYAYANMADGRELKRIISQAAICYYLTKILEDKGTAGLKKALSAIEQTIDYRESAGNSSSVGLRRIYNSFLLKI